jgi:phosphoribosyl-dephospho-CoA transferase
MTALQRNQLVWLTETAWVQVRARSWDAQARAILKHWHNQQLPLVVCRQRVPRSPESISLGLPAPLQWDRRKLALEVPSGAIARSGAFPLLRHIALNPTDASQVQDLLVHTSGVGVAVQVYGSFGWQSLSGLPCVRMGSDLDLLVCVPDLDTASQLARLLQGLQLKQRVDGELVFPGGWALAWREYAQLIGGRVEQVMVKHRTGVLFMDRVALRERFRRSAPQAVPC